MLKDPNHQTKEMSALRRDGEPSSDMVAWIQFAEKVFVEERKDAKKAAQKLSPGFPPLAWIVEFSSGLGWPGKVSKRWLRFTTQIYPEYQAFANFAYEVMADPEFKRQPGKTRDELVWEFMKEEFQLIVEDVLSLVIVFLPELKREIEYRGLSKERMTALDTMKYKRTEQPSLSIAKQREMIDKYGNHGD